MNIIMDRKKWTALAGIHEDETGRQTNSSESNLMGDYSLVAGGEWYYVGGIYTTKPDNDDRRREDIVYVKSDCQLNDYTRE